MYLAGEALPRAPGSRDRLIALCVASLWESAPPGNPPTNGGVGVVCQAGVNGPGAGGLMQHADGGSQTDRALGREEKEWGLGGGGGAG